MNRVLVISDIHGELEKFECLLEKVNYNAEKDQLILLGDYVDRGPNARGVLDKVIELKNQGAIVLRGNHDDMMVAAAEDEENAWKRWEKNGAIFTLKSYDSEINEMRIPDSEDFQRHVAFIKTLDYYYKTDQYIFVHAGVDPDTPIEKTDPYILVWIRDKFHNGYKDKKTVIFGHTNTANLHGKKDNHGVYFGENNIIGIDGGAVYGGSLNCLDITNNKVYHVENR
ncbi:metallophosphoesterase family protein [Oceanobacillus neutriphilus]|uniref:Serine/threonine protein phosphatase n=1 Tax=Oceanobacillus neutriphilus TaxID=531815 RepID=A0ABQ2NNH7_9BACI|nr:metallophosphoesterase family protein [Oceanobacillus neutriphilus]GGP07827.1 serine/threonine protein phosphatase [Oceanobacillus neutriphilus]